MARTQQKNRQEAAESSTYISEKTRGSCNYKHHLSPDAARTQTQPRPTHPALPTASCTAVLTVASSLNTEDTFKKAETTFSGSDVSV